MLNAVVYENNTDSLMGIITRLYYISQVSNRTLCSACCYFVLLLESNELRPRGFALS